jgi:hypothetical protein
MDVQPATAQEQQNDATPAQRVGSSNEWPALPNSTVTASQPLRSGPNLTKQQQARTSSADPSWLPLFSLPTVGSGGGGGRGGHCEAGTVQLLYMRAGLFGVPSFSVRRLECPSRPGCYVGILAVEFCLFHTAATVHLDNDPGSGSVRVDIRASVSLHNALHFRPPTEHAGRDSGPHPGELIAQALVVPPGLFGHPPSSTASSVAALMGWTVSQVGPVVACAASPGALMLLLPDPYGPYYGAT